MNVVNKRHFYVFSTFNVLKKSLPFFLSEGCLLTVPVDRDKTRGCATQGKHGTNYKYYFVKMIPPMRLLGQMPHLSSPPLVVALPVDPCPYFSSFRMHVSCEQK